MAAPEHFTLEMLCKDLLANPCRGMRSGGLCPPLKVHLKRNPLWMRRSTKARAEPEWPLNRNGLNRNGLNRNSVDGSGQTREFAGGFSAVDRLFSRGLGKHGGRRGQQAFGACPVLVLHGRADSLDGVFYAAARGFVPGRAVEALLVTFDG
jgi:hypothetical protein